MCIRDRSRPPCSDAERPKCSGAWHLAGSARAGEGGESRVPRQPVEGFGQVDFGAALGLAGKPVGRGLQDGGALAPAP
eukprot:13649944-Alexandrium_andersonii.AAC.1